MDAAACEAAVPGRATLALALALARRRDKTAWPLHLFIVSSITVEEEAIARWSCEWGGTSSPARFRLDTRPDHAQFEIHRVDTPAACARFGMVNVSTTLRTLAIGER